MSLEYSLPFDAARILNVLEENITPAGRKTPSYLNAVADLESGVFTKLTRKMIRGCGRKANKAVDLDMLYQSFEIQHGKK